MLKTTKDSCLAGFSTTSKATSPDGKGLWSTGRDFEGLQTGFVNWNEGDFFGVQAGGVNFTGGTMKGLQLGAFNSAENLNGFQLGVINHADGVVAGLQIGLLNIMMENDSWFGEFPNALAPAMVFVNWRY